MEDPDDPEWTLAANKHLSVRDHAIWSTPHSVVKCALCGISNSPNPVLFENLGVLIATTFSPGWVFACETETGRDLWNLNLSGPRDSEPVPLGNDRVLVAISKDMLCLDALTGKPIWTATLDNSIGTVPTVFNDMIVTGDSRGNVHGIAADTGTLVWITHESSPWCLGIDGKLTILEGTAIVGTSGGVLCGIEAATGRVTWSKRFPPGPLDPSRNQEERREIFRNADLSLSGRAITQARRGVVLSTPDGGVTEIPCERGFEVEKVCVANNRIIAAIRQEEFIQTPGVGELKMQYQPEHLVCLEPEDRSWRLFYPPYAGPRLTWSPETGNIYESTSAGIGIVNVELGRRTFAIKGFTHREDLPDQRTGIVTATRERIYCITSDGTIMCLRHP